MKKKFLAAALSALVAGAASAQSPSVWLSEVLVNPPGTDNGFEYVEIASSIPSMSLSGFFLLVVEGDGAAAGVVDMRIDLSNMSTGTNNLLLIRDAATVIAPGPESGTSIVVSDFVPDLENGTQTYILCFGNPPALLADVDSNNDGVLDAGALAGCTVVDALGFVENDTANSNVVYSDDLGFTTVGPGLDAGGLPTFNADWLYRFTTASGAAGGWAGTDVLAVGATTASGLIVDNLRQIGFATSTRPAVQTLGAGSTTVRAIDPGVPNLIIADASWTIPQGAGSVGLSISVPSIPGATAFTAVSIDPANGSSTTAYFGNLFGLWIPEADFVFQLTAGVAPFTMALDGSGSASFGLGGVSLPGVTLWAVTVIPNAAVTRVVAQSPVYAITL